MGDKDFPAVDFRPGIGDQDGFIGLDQLSGAKQFVQILLCR